MTPLTLPYLSFVLAEETLEDCHLDFFCGLEDYREVNIRFRGGTMDESVRRTFYG